MVFLMQGKRLLRTSSSTIYKFETGVDNMIFIIPKIYNGINIESLKCAITVEHYSEEKEKNVFEYAFRNYDEIPYKENYLSITIPITTTLTKSEGYVNVWLMFLKENEEDSTHADCVFKTSSSNFYVNDNGSYSSTSEISFDEVWTHTNMDSLNDTIEQLQKQVESVVTWEKDEV